MSTNKSVEAKKLALKGLKSSMNGMGGDSLLGSLNGDKNAYKDGGVVKATVIAKDEKDLKKGLKKAGEIVGKTNFEDGGIVGAPESSENYSEMSKEELIELLKNK